MKPKVYPLDIENVGDDTYHLLSKGHHDLEVFMFEVRSRYPTWPMGEPYHAWVVRAPKPGFKCVYYPCEPTHVWAIPVTCTDEAHGEERHKPKESQVSDSKNLTEDVRPAVRLPYKDSE